ncbi:DUF488 domain-containing protein [Methanoculleus thermophilus]|jgi:uncharacterized protein (DUF488 family)|uniref:Uncharacterized conserved protein, DUF488 family n=1 Tax=Methanoculleus thermophilus TaxID=2200 RepID=A0A1G9A4M4_9EURY|nr:DUF488 domain-containing protein [Methanoculleus thermophilus]SDK21545.1 Uncharacterized conserved protein, DUF488 family [Methanoculleus thermophilus]
MINKSQRAVLFLIARYGKISKMKLVKLMFLISQERSLYNFVPYKYGPFSFQLYRDLFNLEKSGSILIDENVQILDTVFPKPDFFLQEIISSYAQKFQASTDMDIIDYVYDHFPEYTIFSKLKPKKEQISEEKGITTIGYEGKDIDQFFQTLIANRVTLLVDVRRNAFSRKYGYSKEALSRNLQNFCIKYVHIPELGIESSRRRDITQNGYQELFKQYSSELEYKGDLIEKIKALGGQEKIALMCFEKNASHCHRGVIADRLRKEGWEIVDL